MKNEKRYLAFWIAVVILSVFMAVSCSKPDTICYECTAPGIRKIFDNTMTILDTSDKSILDYSTTMGRKALYSNTTGYYSTAIGPSALYTNSPGSICEVIGYKAKCQVVDTIPVILDFKEIK